MAIDRRTALLRTLLGAGGVGLRALATGIPLPLLLRPRRALGAGARAGGAGEGVQRLLLVTSAAGDPLNANVPGTYDDPNLVHGMQAEVAAADVVQRGVVRRGAACWRALPQPLLDRTAFFHHATHTVVHGQRDDALALAGALPGGKSLLGWAAGHLAGPLGSAQAGPICLGPDDGSSRASPAGSRQATLRPTALAAALLYAGPKGRGPLHASANLRGLREDTLAKLDARRRRDGSSGAGLLLQLHANTEAEARVATERLQEALLAIDDDGVAGQTAAAAALFALNVAPALAIHLNWGGDNHNDAELAGEAQAHGQAVGELARLFARLDAVGLADGVTLLNLNGFGRTLGSRHKQATGRDHNANHNVALLMGAQVAGGVLGGVAAMDRDYGATGLDSASGARVLHGADVGFAQTLPSLGKTVARALGIASDRVEAEVRGGKVVAAALRA